VDHFVTRGRFVIYGGGMLEYSPSNLAELAVQEVTLPQDGDAIKVAIAPTACSNAHDRNKAVDWARDAFAPHGANVAILDGICRHHQLTRDRLRSMLKWRQLITEADILFVPTGHSVCLMRQWRLAGLLPVLRRALNRGLVVLTHGDVAGIWFEYVYTDSEQYERKSQYHPFFYRFERGFNIVPGVAFSGHTDDPVDLRTGQRIPPGFHRMSPFASAAEEEIPHVVCLGVRNQAVITVRRDSRTVVHASGDAKIMTVNWGPDGYTSRVWGPGARLVLDDLPPLVSQFS
jgi:hypothetical protein